MKYLLTTLVLLGCLSADGRADFNGIDLDMMCSTDNQVARNQCRAWVSGFQDGIWAEVYAESLGKRICLPDGFSGDQAVPIIQQYMNEHPEELQNNAKEVAYIALFKAFPCSK
jgi:Rap1a immunity proteins